MRKRQQRFPSDTCNGELVGSFFDRIRRPLRAVPLGFDPSSLTAIANDFGYEIIFSRQLQALETAKAMGITTVLFSNHDGGRARPMAGYFLYTPQSSTPQVQELHLLYAISSAR
jgi:D-sedoheptulose 7-phosphate isomerase